MLVLSRKKTESIEIADGLISIMVVDIRGDKCRLGVTAPEDISIHRREVLQAILRNRNGLENPEYTLSPRRSAERGRLHLLLQQLDLDRASVSIETLLDAAWEVLRVYGIHRPAAGGDAA